MKKLYFFVSMGLILVANIAYGQSPSFAEWNSQQVPQLKKGNPFPMFGFSLSIPLFRKYALRKQVANFNLPKQPPPPIALMGGDTLGRIAFEVWDHNGPVIIGVKPGDNAGGVGQSNGYGINWGGSSGGDSNGGDYSGSPPTPVVKSKKFKRDACPGGKSVYKQMLDRQNEGHNEQVAFVTDKGILWLDDANNTTISGQVGDITSYHKDSYGRAWFTVGGQIYTIQAIVHTHPASSGEGVSVADREISRLFGVPIYAIHTSGIWSADPGGASQLADYNLDNAFDCDLSRNLFQ